MEVVELQAHGSLGVLKCLNGANMSLLTNASPTLRISLYIKVPMVTEHFSALKGRN